jgi:phospholipid/cholesterol/gamma-HCH transport system substrate-binding protein
MSQSLRVGIFVILTLAAFGAGVFWIGQHQFLFSSTYHLYSDFSNVAGLVQGAAVRVGGIREGTIRKIILPNRPDQKVRVEMDLNWPTRNVIRKDSVAAIRTEGLVGDQYMEISFGSPEAPSVNNGDTIASEPPLEISDVIKKTNSLLDSAQGAMQNISQATGNLDAVSSKINQGRGSLGSLINDRSLYQHVDEAAENLQEDTEALKHNFLTRGFFKKRGYEDESELTKHAIAQLPERPPSQRFSWLAGKLFEKPDSAKIKHGKMLDEAGQYLQQNPFGLAVVAGYADMKGGTGQDRELTEARAAVVRDYLVQHFKLDDTRIKTIGLGKSSGAPDGGDVEVLVYPAGVGTADRKSPAPR